MIGAGPFQVDDFTFPDRFYPGFFQPLDIHVHFTRHGMPIGHGDLDIGEYDLDVVLNIGKRSPDCSVTWKCM